MTVYLFAGPNGSGKSTLIKDYISFYGLEDVEYICPDIYASSLFRHIDDLYERYRKAMEFAAYKREKLLSSQKSMIIETVLSRSDKLDFLKKAAAAGYRIVSVFVGTSSPDINCARVLKRVSEGGHGVPEEKIRERYVRSLKNLPLLAGCSDELYVFDNSGDRPFSALTIIGSDVFIAPDAPDWVKRIFPAADGEDEKSR